MGKPARISGRSCGYYLAMMVAYIKLYQRSWIEGKLTRISIRFEEGKGHKE